MKRRTFLRLSSAALASLGLSACGAKKAASVSSGSTESDGPYDEVGDDDGYSYSITGMTLEEAQNYSSYYNCTYFIHCNDGLFYPLEIPRIPFYTNLHSPDTDVVFICNDQRIIYDYCDPLYLEASSGDELVFISTEFSVPASVEFFATNGMYSTVPATFSSSSIYPLYEHRYDLHDSISSMSDTQVKFLNNHCYLSQLLPGQQPNASYGGRGSILENCAPLTFNGTSFEEFTNQNHFNEIANGTGYFNLFTYNESTLSVGYYEGSFYKTLVLEASAIAFTFDHTNPSNSCATALTQNGYATVDTSSLEKNNYYLISYPAKYSDSVSGLPFYAIIGLFEG